MFQINPVSVSNCAYVDQDIGQFLADRANRGSLINSEALGLADGLEELPNLFSKHQALLHGPLFRESALVLHLTHVGLKVSKNRVVLQMKHLCRLLSGTHRPRACRTDCCRLEPDEP